MPFDSVNIKTYTSIGEISGIIVSDIDMGIYTLYSSTQAASLGTAATSTHGLGTGDIIIGDDLEVDGETYFDRPTYYTEVTQASVAVPAANSDAFFFDSADGLPKFKDDGGTVHSFDENSVQSTRTLTAGAGLTGGGTLAADRTFNVVANADGSIISNANDIQVGILATDVQHGVRGGGTQHANAIAAGAAGFMTGADKTKLDGIATSAAALTASAPVNVTKAAAAVGVATDAARADHKHDITTAATSANPPGTASAEGTATSLARSDHTHALAAFGTTTGTFAQGDDTRIVNAVQTTRTLTAGTGLTGGGTLAADRTFNVVANVDGSILANADDIQVGILATDAQHGTRGGGTIHSAATTTVAGFLSATDKKRQGHVYNAVADFGFVGDLISVGETTAAGTSVVMTSGSPTITLTQQAPFTSTAVDGGKRIIVEGAGASGGPLVTTISTVTSASVATLAANASTTVTASTTVEINVSFGTDNSAATTAMTTLVNTTNATYPGVKIFFPQSATNAYWFTTPVVFNKTVQIEGVGGGHTTDSGQYTRIGGTRLAWGGTSQDGGTAFGAFFTFVPTSTQTLKRVAMRSCWLDCRNNNQNQALVGLKLSSCHGFILEDFFICDAQAMGIWTDIGTTPTEAKDTTRFSIRDVCIRSLDNGTIVANLPMTTPILMTSAVVLTTSGQSLTVAANTLPNVASGYFWTATTSGAPTLVRYTGGGGTTTLTGCTIATEFVVHTPTTVNGGNVVQACPGNSCCIMLNGGAAANTCCGVLEMLQLSHGTTWGPAAMEFCNTDSLLCFQVMINGGSATVGNAINRVQKPGVRQNGSIVSATLASRNNRFIEGDYGVGGFVNMALTNASVLLTAPSGPTYLDGVQTGNGAPLPTREVVTASVTQAAIGSYTPWTFNGGFVKGGVAGPVAINGVLTTLTAAATNLVPGTVISVPPQGIQIGTSFRFIIHHSKTAAGVAARTILVKFGAAGTAADTTIASQVLTPSSTATADTGLMIIDMCVTALGAGSAAAAMTRLHFTHNLVPSATVGGLSNSLVPVQIFTMTPTGFNSTLPSTSPAYFSVWITAGVAEIISILSASVQCINPGNPQ